ncbi:hypothetical protein [Micromonospora sp. KLBMP9576]|uniref:hypothetical protein n=1 Tax=Micromonospora sp. KLBMP9576 TaxID=3424769 RepID=UPI003D8C4BF8
MARPHVSLVGEMEIRPAAVALPGQRPFEVRDDWIVTVDEGGTKVIAAVPAAMDCTGGPVAERDIIVVDAAWPVAAALNSQAFDEARWPPTVVVRAGDKIVGVWADEDLADVWPHRQARGSVDVGLPGDVRIPLLRRRCGFRDKARCSARRDFEARPHAAVQCSNPDGFADHHFVW